MVQATTEGLGRCTEEHATNASGWDTSIVEFDQGVEVMLDQSFDSFQVSSIAPSVIEHAARVLPATHTIRDKHEQAEARNDVETLDGNVVSVHRPPLSDNFKYEKGSTGASTTRAATKGESEIVLKRSCNTMPRKIALRRNKSTQETRQGHLVDRLPRAVDDKSHTSDAATLATVTDDTFEIIFESSVNQSQPKSLVEQKDPVQQEVTHSSSRAYVRFGSYVYQVVAPAGVPVYQNAQDLVWSSVVDLENQNQNSNHDYITKAGTTLALECGQMIQVDQAVQINSIDKDSQLQTADATCIVVHSPTEIVRLAHDEGWAACEWNGERLLQAVPVWTGLWCWYVHHNCTEGLAISKHPTNHTPRNASEDNNHFLLPLQKIYCDAKVIDNVSGKIFYRLQTKSTLPEGHSNNNAAQVAALEQATMWNGWICDTTMQGQPTLLAEEQVKTNLELVVCNRRQGSMPVYSQPSVGRDRDIQKKIPPGEMVVVRKMVWTDGLETNASCENVEFEGAKCMQLSDRSGWVVEGIKKTKTGPHTQEVQAISGNWTFRVMNEQGIKSYTHPSTKLSSQTKEGKGSVTAVLYPYASILRCDCRVTNPTTGRPYYRLKETGKWIPGEHESTKWKGVKKWAQRDSTDNTSWLIELFEAPALLAYGQGHQQDGQTWNPDFVSGIAATVPGRKKSTSEVPEGSRLFETEDGILIQVFCDQRSVDIELQHKVHGRVRMCWPSCSTNDLCSILRMDPMELVSAMDTIDVDRVRMTHEHEEEKADGQAEKEKRLRQELLRCSSKVNSLLKAQRNLINQLASFDGKRQVDLMQDVKDVPDYLSSTSSLGTEDARLSWMTLAPSTGIRNSKRGIRRGVLRTRRMSTSPRRNYNTQVNRHVGVGTVRGSVWKGQSI